MMSGPELVAAVIHPKFKQSWTADEEVFKPGNKISFTNKCVELFQLCAQVWSLRKITIGFHRACYLEMIYNQLAVSSAVRKIAMGIQNISNTLNQLLEIFVNKKIRMSEQ